MAWLGIKVQWAPTFGPLESASIWEDITDYVEDISINRGRSDELSQFSAGRATLVLRNDDRRFDPKYSTGPYFGNLLPKKQFMILVDDGVDLWGLFTGFCRGFPTEIEYVDNRAYTTIELIDAFEALESKSITGSMYTQATLNDPDVWAWYRFKDRLSPLDGYVVATDSGPAGLNGRYLPRDDDIQITDGSPIMDGSVYVPGGSAVADQSGTRIQFERWGWLAGGTTEFTFECVFKTDIPQQSTGGMYQAGAIVYSLPFEVQIVPDGGIDGPGRIRTILVTNDTPFHAENELVSVRAYADNRWHHLVITADTTAGLMSMYVDGVLETQTTLAGTYFFPSSRLNDNESKPRIGGVHAHNFQGSIGDIIFYGVEKSASWVASRYEIMGGYPGETSGSKIGRLLTLFGWNPFASFISGGNAIVEPDASGSYLSNIQRIAEAELGLFYVDGFGSIHFLDRTFYLTDSRSNIVQAQFSDAGTGFRYVEVKLAEDDQFIYNAGVASREGGPVYEFVDQASADQFFERTSAKTGLVLANDNDALSYAYWLAHRQSQPKDRVLSLTLDARTSADVAEQCYVREIGDRVSVERQPMGLGDVWIVEGIIDSINHQINLNRREWNTTFKLAPIDDEGILILDHVNDNIDLPLGF